MKFVDDTLLNIEWGTNTLGVHDSLIEKLERREARICVALDQTTLPHFDALLLCTDRDRFDYDLIQRHGKLIIDTRGHYCGNTLANLRHA